MIFSAIQRFLMTLGFGTFFMVLTALTANTATTNVIGFEANFGIPKTNIV